MICSMNVEIFTLCRETRSGGEQSFDILGVFDTETSNTAPALIQGELVVKLRFRPTVDREGVHKIEIRLIDDGGRIVDSISDQIQLSYDGFMGASHTQTYPLRGVGVPRFGMYTFSLRFDNSQVSTIPFVLKSS